MKYVYVVELIDIAIVKSEKKTTMVRLVKMSELLIGKSSKKNDGGNK